MTGSTIARSQKRCYDKIETKGLVWHTRFHPSQAKLACGLDGGRICIFSGRSHSSPFSDWELATFWATSSSFVLTLDWSNDGTKLAAGCKDGSVVIWDEEGEKLYEFRPNYAITCLTCDDGSVVVLREDDLKDEVKGHDGTVRCLQWNHEAGANHLIATGSDDTSIVVWDSMTGADVQRFKFHAGWIWDLRWISTDTFASCSDDFTIKICRIGANAPLHNLSHHPFQWVYSLRWNASNKQLSSCAPDGSVKVWTIGAKEPITDLRTNGSPVNCLDWYHQKRSVNSLLASGRDDSVAVWELNAEAVAVSENPQVMTGHTARISSVAFSPNGQYLASLDDQGNLIVWSTQDWSSVFQTETAAFVGGWLDRLSWDSTGRKLAVANRSPEVFVVEFSDDTAN